MTTHDSNGSARDDTESNIGKSSCTMGVDSNSNNKNDCQNSRNCQMDEDKTKTASRPTGALNSSAALDSSAALAVLKEAVKCVKDATPQAVTCPDFTSATFSSVSVDQETGYTNWYIWNSMEQHHSERTQTFGKSS